MAGRMSASSYATLSSSSSSLASGSTFALRITRLGVDDQAQDAAPAGDEEACSYRTSYWHKLALPRKISWAIMALYGALAVACCACAFSQGSPVGGPGTAALIGAALCACTALGEHASRRTSSVLAAWAQLLVTCALGVWSGLACARGERALVALGVVAGMLASQSLLLHLSCVVSGTYIALHVMLLGWLRSLVWHAVMRRRHMARLGGVARCDYLGPTAAACVKALAFADLPAKPRDCVRVVCLSDTHRWHEAVALPAGDVLVHAGDVLFKDRGLAPLRPWTGHSDGLAQLSEFNRWLERQPHAVKLFIGGNHDAVLAELGAERVRQLVPAGLYLCDELAHVVVPGAPRPLRVYGNATTHRGSSPNTAFQVRYDSPAERAAWRRIPSQLDILATHQTPHLPSSDASRACSLGAAVLARAPKLHVCGHFHNMHGGRRLAGAGGAPVALVNAAIMDNVYLPRQAPIVVDLKLAP